MKAFALFLTLSALALADDQTIANDLSITLEEYEYLMALSGILLASFFNFMLWKMAP